MSFIINYNNRCDLIIDAREEVKKTHLYISVWSLIEVFIDHPM